MSKSVEETKRKIEVMQAFVDGKEIQFRRWDNDVWFTATGPCWYWETYDFRIKPEPRKFYLNLSHGTPCGIYDSLTTAIDSAKSLKKAETIELMEVIKDE